MARKIEIVLIILFAITLTGCGGKDANTAKGDTMIPVPTYVYYAVSPGETEITVNLILFCPTEISKATLAKTTFALGNTGSIQVTKSEIFQTYTIKKANYYYAHMLFTLDVQSMTGDTLQFSTLSYTLPDKAPQYLHIGPVIIDRHFSMEKDARFLSAEEEGTLVATTKAEAEYDGYPDNPNYYANVDYGIKEMYPDVVYYQTRPVRQYTVDGQTAYAFQQQNLNFLQNFSLKDLLTTSKSAYAPYKEAYDAAKVLRDTVNE